MYAFLPLVVSKRGNEYFYDYLENRQLCAAADMKNSNEKGCPLEYVMTWQYKICLK